MAPAYAVRRGCCVIVFLSLALLICFPHKSAHAAGATQSAPEQSSADPTAAARQNDSQPLPASSSPQSTQGTASQQTMPEITQHEATTMFQVNVRLVQVHVVVREGHGKAIGTLHKEDFHLFDNGKPQVITQFNIEQPGFQVAREQKTSDSSTSGKTPAALLAVPERYIAYVFDDVHLAMSDLMQARIAAERNMATLRPTDRAAIFTTSEQNSLDFTDDRTKLHEALLKLVPKPFNEGTITQCPKMTYYIADLIINKNDAQAMAVVTTDALACQFQDDPDYEKEAEQLARVTAMQGLASGDAETHLVLASMKDIIRRLSAAPGERLLVLVSPGFITPTQEFDRDEIVDRAVRANITINTLDARGLYVEVPGGDAARAVPPKAQIAAIETQYQLANDSANDEVMQDFANGTGGTFFHNSNDLDEGFKRVASAPEYYYLLSFSPQNLKLNGQFHKLKVTVNAAEKFSIQARRGYFAPKQSPRPEQQAKQEIEDAVFSQEEMHELPIDLHTQYFKPNDAEAKLMVLAHVDVRQLHFQKANGRNNSSVTIVSAVFDRNGNFVTGIEKTVQLHLNDDTLNFRMGPGLSVKTNFDLKPGGYLVRLVVRGPEGEMSAENGAVQIP
jgi:VWFA-related protein